jgi:predicted permease
MVGVLIGFAIIVAVIAVGYLIGRLDLLGDHAQHVLSRLAFFVLSPALLFTVLSEADVSHLFSALLPISAIAVVANIVVFLVVALVVWRRRLSDATIGALASGYVNANNIGLPVSVYVLGDASSSAPVILLQLIVLAPIALTVLDVTTSGRVSVGRILLQPVRNPLIIGSLLGVIVAVTHLKLPAPVLAPFELVGGAAVPVILLTFGMSLHGSRVLAPGTDRRDVLLASSLKLAAMPVVAWLLGQFVWHLHGHRLFVVVVLAALPTAQNVFNYAQRYGVATVLARDTVLITTALSIVVLVIVAALLA